ncbi:MAG: hypothetical protein AAF223_02475 [Bacteroidota bacterium]
MKKTVTISAISVILIAIAVYAWLGGFQSEQINEITYDRRIVYGTRYEGKYGDLKLRETVVKTQQMIEDNSLQGHLIVVNYDSSATSENIDQFIGILSSDLSAEALQKLSQDTLPSGEYLKIQVYGQPVVWPTPAQVSQYAEKYAQQQQIDLGTGVIEHYFGSDSMWIEFPIMN